MKCFIAFVFVCGFYVKAHAIKSTDVDNKEIYHLEVDPVSYEVTEQNFLREGAPTQMVCKGLNKSQKLDWYNPAGELVKRKSNGRVFSQEYLLEYPAKTLTQRLVLVFKNLMVSDSGVWECRSGDRIQKISLCVLDAAEFVDTPVNVTVDDGRSITLTCQSRGYPEPKIQWYKDGELLSDETTDKFYTSTKYNHHGIEGLLTIKSVSSEDSGVYVCETSQEVPYVEQCTYSNNINITLYVNHAPKFKKRNPVHIFAFENESVNLSCAPSVYPAAKFRWFRQVGEISTEFSGKEFVVSEDENMSQLFLEANSSTFNQLYKCLVENVYGVAAQTFKILEMLKPLRLTEINLVNATDSELEFNITWDSDVTFPIDVIEMQHFERITTGAPNEVQWRRAKMDTIYSDEFSDYLWLREIGVSLSDLKDETEYWVRFRAVNKLGPSPWSPPTLASTLEAEDTTDEEEFKEYPFDMGMIVGAFLTCVIIIFAAGCIVFIKKL